MKLSSFGSLCGRSVAFTMAEILLSLTIIGVVAAITLPSLTGNINERTWNTQRKALFARMSQAVSLMNGMRGYGNVEVVSNINGYHAGEYNIGNATEIFLSNGLAKVFKLNNICDASHISDCGMPGEIINMVGSKVAIKDMIELEDFHDNFWGYGGCGGGIALHGTTAAFETANGESVFAIYNPVCLDAHTVQNRAWGGQGGDGVSVISPLCANFVYDLNGKKGPNTVGKDVGFMSVFYPADPIVVAPVPAAKNASDSVTVSQASGVCKSSGDDYRVPNFEEMLSLAVNTKFIGNLSGYYVTSKKADSFDLRHSYSGGNDKWWGVEYDYLTLFLSPTEKYAVRCVKR